MNYFFIHDLICLLFIYFLLLSNTFYRKFYFFPWNDDILLLHEFFDNNSDLYVFIDIITGMKESRVYTNPILINLSINVINFHKLIYQAIDYYCYFILFFTLYITNQLMHTFITGMKENRVYTNLAKDQRDVAAANARYRISRQTILCSATIPQR